MADALAFDIIGRDKASPAFAKVAKSIEATEKSASSLERGMGNLGSAAVGVAAGFGALEIWNRTVGAASDLNETVSKTRTIFGDSSAAIEKFGDSAAESVGMSKRAALEGVASFGNLFQQIGLSGDAASAMSTNLVKLTADFASFHNAQPAEVMDALLSATRGEYDALQRFVPTASAAAVEAQALADSGKSSATQLTAAEKATGLYNLILKDAGAAQGDFARTSDSAANQQRILMARVEDTGAAIGGVLLPAYQGFLGVINDIGPLNALGAAAALVFGNKIGDAVELSRVAVGVWGSELMDSVNATNSASGSTGRFNKVLGTTRVIAGGAGKALTGLVGFLGGPWGIALAGAAIAAGILTQRAAEQRQKAENLKESLALLAGTYDELIKGNTGSTKALIENDKNLQNLVLSAAEFGVATDDIVRAMNGEEGALNTINDAYDTQIAKLKELADVQLTGDPVQDAELKKRAKVHEDEIARLENERKRINETLDAKVRSKAATDQLAVATKDEAAAAAAGTPAQIALSDAMGVLADSTASAEDKIKALKTAQDALFGAQISQSEALEAYQASIDAMTNSIKENGKTLNVNTEAGRQNRDAIEARIDASKRMYEADIAAGVSVEEATRRHKARIDALRREAKAAGLSKKDTEALIRTYGNVPTDIETVIRTKGHMLTQDRLANLLALKRSLEKGISLSRAKAEQRKLLAMAEGGMVHGPGTETSDDVPAWLSRGEFVHTAAAVKYYGADTMEALNKRQIPKHAIGYRRGGLVKVPIVVDTSKTQIPSRQSIIDKYGPSLGADPSSAIGAIMRVARHIYPGARLSSGYRPGDPGYHGRGLAADIIGGGAHGMATIARGFDRLAPRLIELIHSGGGGYFVKNGQRVGSGYYRSAIAGHYDHVHVAARKDALAGVFDQGGYLMPGLNLAYNGTGKPERVLGPGESGSVVVNINGPVYGDRRQLKATLVGILDDLRRDGRLPR